jgi:hypothetical protein
MRLGLLPALIVLAGCAAPQPSPPMGNRSTATPAAGASRTTNTISQDAVECERQAAISASAGSRAQAFNDCMKARGRAPGR